MSHAPLHGVKVLDFSTLLPGPYATMILGDLGADVLRVDAPNRPDLIRLSNPVVYDTLNRNKKSVCLDLKTAEAVAIIKKLVHEYDVVLEQFRPGVMKSLGLDYETLRQENPGLIYCSLTGYGQTGPMAQRAGHDINYLALSGLNSFSGTHEQGPSMLGTQIADLCGGALFSVTGILTAVIHRQKTGEGQHIDVSMLDGSMALGILGMSEWLGQQKNSAYESGLLNGGTFYNHYKTKDGRYLSVGSLEPKFFEQLAKGLELPELLKTTDPNQMIELIEQKIASRTLKEWEGVFKNLDACVEPVLTLAEVEQTEQFKAREMAIELSSDAGKKVRQLAHPLKFSQTAPVYHHIGPKPGANNQEILEQLGISPEESQQLKEKGVLGQETETASLPHFKTKNIQPKTTKPTVVAAESPATKPVSPESIENLFAILPKRAVAAKLQGVSMVVHFDISGDTGGKYTVKVQDGRCEVEAGHQGTATCVVEVQDKVYLDVELGRMNPQMAFMSGKLKVSNIGAMMQFVSFFSKVTPELLKSAPVVTVAPSPVVSEAPVESVSNLFKILPTRFLADRAKNGTMLVHFKISGKESGEYSVRLENGKCEVEKGLVGKPTCVVDVNDQAYLDVELGRMEPQVAFMSGKLKVDNIGAMMQFVTFFERITPDVLKQRLGGINELKSPAVVTKAEPTPEKTVQPVPVKETLKVEENVQDIFKTLPKRFRSEKADGVQLTLGYKISGENGGDYSVLINSQSCTVENSLKDKYDCLIETSDEVFVDLEFGRIQADAAFTKGLLNISNIAVNMRYNKLFSKIEA
ncbi:MAG: CoA transferase [SAR324 cluster bacterium]|nr:CoA transferase [SAR324 cluster bacterium]